MSRKYTIEEVRELFVNKGYELLSDEYVGANEKLKYICPKHPNEVQETTASKIRNANTSCWYCSYEDRGDNLRISYEQVKKAFEDRGYTLLSKTYKMKHHKLDYFCPHHPDKKLSISFHSFTNGESGCPHCAGNAKYEFEYVKSAFEEKGYELLETEYLNAKHRMQYRCPVHQVIHTVTFSDLQNGQGCRECSIKNRSGINHPLWNGGISKIEYVLRHCIGEWKRIAMKEHDGKCFILGTKDNLVLHHVTPFNEIVNEAVLNLKLDRLESANQYSENDIKQLKRMVIDLHKNVEGVPLNKNIHIEFHNQYGYHGATKEQLIEFKNSYTLSDVN